MLSVAEKREIGFKVREENSGIKEKTLCEKYGLTQIGGSQTKVDGTNGVDNYSIKNMSGNSTQVHITTQKQFLKSINASDKVSRFVEMFCGTQKLFDSGKDRFTTKEIFQKEPEVFSEFEKFFNQNKKEIIDYIISGDSNITHILVKDSKNNQENLITKNELMNKVEDCYWKFSLGGIHLKNKDNKTLFHFQREGKKGGNPNKIKGVKFKNRFNVLWHIHKNVFL